MSDTLLLVGAGPMAAEYAKVLRSLGTDFTVVGRGEKSAASFEEAVQTDVSRGGIEMWLSSPDRDTSIHTAIVAVSEKQLGKATLALLEQGFDRILVEKPGGFNDKEINAVFKKAKNKSAQVYVGYNRRFYASVIKARELIKKDGGVSSLHFEFTEWSHRIKDLVKEEGVLQEWYLHNSSHIIDMAFYLGGWPRKIASFISGSLPWHPRASAFTGAGICDTGALFSYQANWEAPGRWSVEIETKKHRLYFRPIETLQIQNIGSIALEHVDIEDRLDTEYKPGLYKQVEAFFKNDNSVICSIKEQKQNMPIYNKIRGS
ncbi:Gfo/Idh/MocA family protein [Spirochaetota bacterium]